MEKLISNTDFGFYVRELEINDHKKLELRENYDSFQKQPLTLGMFVPCDLDGNVLQEPNFYEKYGSNYEPISNIEYTIDYRKYQEAKYRVLFEGLKFEDVQPSTEYNYYHIGWVKIFEANNQYKFFPCNGFKTVEDLTKLREVLLTESAKQKIGL